MRTNQVVLLVQGQDQIPILQGIALLASVPFGMAHLEVIHALL
jgi:hypothetical protein